MSDILTFIRLTCVAQKKKEKRLTCARFSHKKKKETCGRSLLRKKTCAHSLLRKKCTRLKSIPAIPAKKKKNLFLLL